MAGWKEIDLDLALGELLVGGHNTEKDFRSAGGCQARKKGLVEFEVDNLEVVDVILGDAVDSPDARSDEGRFGGEMDRDVAQVGAGGVAYGQLPNDGDRVLIECEIDIFGGRANDLDGVH